MSVKAILFDLDATLLPLDQDGFIKEYFTRLTMKLASVGYESGLFMKSLTAGIRAMRKNDGTRLNEQAFWAAFSENFGDDIQSYYPYFEQFYTEEFDKIKDSCGYNPKASYTVRRVKELGFRTVLATSPVFPSVATEKRMRWAGVTPDDFELYTTYENCTFCKPNPAYYTEIAEKIGLSPEECLMVGNDVDEDMSAREAGMEVFLLTDLLINREGKDISIYQSGGFDELITLVESKL